MANEFQALTARGLRDAYHALSARPLPTTEDKGLDWLVDELSVRELLAAHCFARDAKDTAWLKSLFTQDAVLTDDEQRCSGRDEIGARAETVAKSIPASFRRYANPVIRFDANGEQGWVGAYTHAGVQDERGAARSTFGIQVGRIVKQDGAWRFADLSIATESTFDFPGDKLKPLWVGFIIQPDGLHREVAFNPSRKKFYETAEDPWGGARIIFSQTPRPQTRDDKIRLLSENIAVRDLFARYVESYDSNNVTRVMDRVMAEDSLHQNRGDKASFLVGKAEMRKQYQIWNGSRRLSFHRVSNIVARISDDGREALACAYFNAPIMGHTGEPQAQFGGYFFRLLKENGDWRLSDRRQIGPNGRMFVFPYKLGASVS